MQDVDKTKEELATEVAHLRQRVAELEQAETERKQAEAKSQELEQKWHLLMANIPDTIISTDRDGTILALNRTVSGIIVGEVIGQKIYDFAPPEYHDTVRKSLEQAFKTGRPNTYQVLGTGPHGPGTAWYETRVIPIKRGKQITTVTLISTDITERKQVEEALERNEQEKAAIFDSISEHVVYQDARMKVLWANRAAGESVGVDPQQLVGRHCYEIWQQRRKPCVGCPVVEARKSGQPQEAEMTTPDGRVWFIRGYPVRDKKGNITGAVEVTLEITARKRAEESLKKSEELYRTLVENINCGINLIDADHNIIMVNTPTGYKFNKPILEIAGKKCFREFEKRDVVCPNCPGVQTLATGKPAEAESEGVLDDGSRFDVRIQTFPIVGQDGTVTAFIEFVEDITERKQMEKELRESEERFRALFEGAPDAIFLADPESGVILDANPAASHLLLRPLEEIIGLHQSQLHPSHMGKYVRDKFAEHLQQIRKKKQVRPIESAVIRSDGSEVTIEVLAQIVHIDGKDVIQGTFREITERKQSEEALKQSEERFRGFIETSNDLVFQLNRMGRIDYVSPRITELYGYEPTELIGKHLRTTTPVKEVSKALEALKRVLAGKTLENFEINQKDKVGRIIPMEINAVPIYKDGKIVGIQGVMRNITARKQAEEKLRESEERFRTICETAQDFIALKDRDCKFTYVNPAMERIFGIPASKLIGRTSTAIFGKERSARIIEEDLRVLNGEIINEEHPSPVKGSSAIHNIIKVPIRNSAGEIIGLCNIGRDITERKQTEEALKESEEKFRELAEQSPNMIFINAEGRVVYANKECEEMMGYTRKDFYDPNFDFFTLIAPESKDVVKERYYRHMKGEDVPPYEYTLITKKGERIEAIISPKMIQYGGESAILGIVTDITERKRMEEELRESEEKYRSLVESSEDSIYLVDNKCTYIFLNNRHLSRLGVQSSQVIGKEYSEFHSPEESKDFRQRVETVLKTGQPLSYEYQSQRDNRYFIRTLSPVTSPDGGVINAITVISKDITERKQAEEALREREAFNYALFQYNPVETIIVDLEGRVTGFNLAKRNSGDRLPTIGDRMYKDYAGKHEIDMHAELIKCIRSGEIREFPERKYEDKYLSITISPFSQGAIIISEDITERKRADEALRESEQFSSSLLNDSPNPIIVINPDTSIRYVSPALEKLTGFSAAEVLGRNAPYPWWGYEIISETTIGLKRAIKQGSQRREQQFQTKSGDPFWVEITSEPVMHDGKVQYLLTNWIDVTERKRAEELLQKERDTFYSILDRAPYGVMVVDADGNHSFVNSEFTNITGYNLGDIPTTQEWLHRAYPDQHYRDMVKETWKNDYTQNRDEEIFRKQFGRVFSRAFNVKCKDGTAKEIEFRTASIGDEGTMFMLSDITERQRMHALLESAAAEWRTTFDAISDAVCLLDSHGRIIRCNNAMLRLLRKPFSQITNHHCWEVMHGASEAPHGCPIALAGKTNHRETEVMFKDSCWFNISVDPLLDEEGNFVGGVHIMSDITDRMRIQNELQDSREQLRNLTVYLQSVREQERTNIAREIHDELAQALTALKMDVSWLDRRLPADAQSLSEKTESMGKLIDSTIQTVKRISAELRPGVLDDLGLVAAIEWQAEEFQNRTGIICHITVDPQDLMVDQDRSTAIFRIFQETLTNVTRHARATRVAVSLKERAGKLTLRVRDNGIGITEEQIFDPHSFGLIGMQERIIPWGGTINFKGTPGKGTTVIVRLGLGHSKKGIEKIE